MQKKVFFYIIFFAFCILIITFVANTNQVSFKLKFITSI